MKFLIDVHLPIALSKFLDKQANCTAIHVNNILHKWNTTDLEISNYADKNGFIVVSKDADFKHSHFVKNSPLRLIRIVLGNTKNEDLIILFEKYLPFISKSSNKSKFYIEMSTELLSIID